MIVVLLLLFLGCIISTDPPTPDLKPRFREFTQEEKCFPGNTCLGVGKKACLGVNKGGKISSVFFLIRNRLFPFITVGSRGLDFVASSNRVSLMVYGFFEYKKGGGKTSGPFKPIEDGDEVVAQYLFNKQGSRLYKAVKWLEMKSAIVDVTTEKKVYSFTLQPNFTRMGSDFPRFAMTAYMANQPIEEEGEGLKNNVLDPSSVKISFNVSNAGCKNTSAHGFGIAMLMIAKAKAKKKSGFDNTDPQREVPYAQSDSQDVFNVEGDVEGGDGSFFSFSKKVGKRQGGKQISSSVYVNWVGLDKIKTRFGTNFVHLNETTMGMYGVKGRSINVVWMSFDDCNMKEFYYDPAIGFDATEDAGFSVTVYMMLVFVIAFALI